MRKLLKIGSIAAGLFLLLLVLWIFFEFVLTRGNTPGIHDEHGQEKSGSVASLEQLRLGDVEQYVLIRGHDTTKPVLLFLHGGPGIPAMFLAHAFQRKFEKEFIMVHWDRRGAGKSYEAGVRSESLTVRQTLDDLYELTGYLRNRFHKDRIYLLGHSWGSYLGVLAAAERPEFFHAYVGAGQWIADSVRERIVVRRFFYNLAKGKMDSVLLQRILRGERMREDDLFEHGLLLRGARSFLPIVLTGLRAPEYTLFDALKVSRGAEMTARRMQYDVISEPLDKVALEFKIPVFFFLGRYDYNTPYVLAQDYFLALKAPLKEIAWFHRSAHFPFWEESDKFLDELLRVRDVVANIARSTAMASLSHTPTKTSPASAVTTPR